MTDARMAECRARGHHLWPTDDGGGGTETCMHCGTERGRHQPVTFGPKPTVPEVARAGVLRYPGAALVALVLAGLSAISAATSTDYTEGETAARLIDFGVSLVFTWAVLYGAVALVGWLVRAVRS